MTLEDIYEAFPQWKDATFRRVQEWRDRMITIKQELERETTPERGLSMKDIFEASPHVPDTVMYADGNLNPPALQCDIDIQYTVV